MEESSDRDRAIRSDAFPDIPRVARIVTTGLLAPRIPQAKSRIAKLRFDGHPDPQPQIAFIGRDEIQGSANSAEVRHRCWILTLRLLGGNQSRRITSRAAI